MDTTGIQLHEHPRRAPLITVVAVALALLIGAALGATITNALTASRAAVVVAPVADTWDAGKLDAMAGRQLFTATPVPQVPWDQQKLDAMSGRQLAG